MKKIQLKNVKDIFPDEYTKVNMEDFLRIANENKNKLSPKEFNKLMELPIEAKRDRRYNGGFEFMAHRKKGRIELIELDD